MQRRQFIKSLILSSAALGYWTSGTPFVFSTKKAHATTGTKTLVNIFQRGACDGLNTVVPYGDPDYAALRPTIKISPPNSGEGSVLDLNGFFGMHPSMAGLHELYHSGELAIFPATHYPDPSRSHFDSQHFIESAQSTRSTDGWMNRHLVSQSKLSSIRALSIGNDLVHAMRGDVSVSTLAGFSSLGFDVGELEEQAMFDRLAELYEHPVSELSDNQQLVHSFGKQMLNDIEILKAIGDRPYEPENGAVYPQSSFGEELKVLAQVLKAEAELNLGLEMANIDIGGWDTHTEQGGAAGRQASRLQDLSEGLTAFYKDMEGRMSEIAVLVSTEFGRTAHENGNGGTDHGMASTWMVLGGGVAGGIHGTWPGLSNNDLVDGRFLRMTVDYRDIYGDILTGFLGNNDIDTVLPNHQYSSLGIF